MGAVLCGLLAVMFWVLSNMGPFDLRPSRPPDPAFIGAVLVLVPLFGSAMVLLSAMIAGAVFRATLRPGERSFAYIRLGPDEGRLIAIMLVWLLAVGIPYLLAVMLMFSIELAVKFVGAWVFGLPLLFCGIVVWMIFVGVRLCLVGPSIVAERRLDIGRAWRLTRGRFWPLLGMAVVAFALSTATQMVLQAILEAPLAPLMTPLMASPGPLTAERLRAFLPWLAILAPFSGVVLAAQQVIALAPFAAAYQILAQEKAEHA